jgi:hypothetical protein
MNTHLVAGRTLPTFRVPHASTRNVSRTGLPPASWEPPPSTRPSTPATCPDQRLKSPESRPRSDVGTNSTMMTFDV